MTNILEEANRIVNVRDSEKEKAYGPFSESLTKTAEMASLMSGKKITTEDVFLVLIALKLSRHSYGFKEDSLLDAVAYIGGLNNFLNENR